MCLHAQSGIARREQPKVEQRFVERSGQGADRMFEESIREGKPRPDFAGTDPYQVALTLRGEIQDEAFLRFLERIGQETLASFSTTDLVVLDLVHRGEEIPKPLAPCCSRSASWRSVGARS